MAPHLEQLQHPPISIDKVPEWQEEEDCCFKLPIQDAASDLVDPMVWTVFPSFVVVSRNMFSERRGKGPEVWLV